MTDDPTLLRRYADDRSEAAFAEFVRRHLPLVYAAALRRLEGDAHRAKDVAQVVFGAVARNARRLARHAELTAWLYTATRNAVVDVIRSESRRRVREQEAQLMHATSLETDTPADWSRLRPVLDAAMDELGGDDREAVLLRYFQDRPFAEIGAALKLSEDAARKRVERAVDKLRSLLGRHGIASTSTALASLLAAETLSAAPANLAASITGAALATGGATVGAASFMALTKLQLGLAAAVVASGAAGLIMQQRSIATLRESNATLRTDITRQAAENTRLAQATAQAATVVRSTGTFVARSVTSGSASAAPSAVAPPATISRTASNPARLAQYHERFDGFVRERGLNSEQADKLFGILSEWDDMRVDFQNSIRAQGLVWTPEAQKMRDELQQKNEVEPLIALLGKEGERAYFDYEGSTFYRALIEPIAQKLALFELPLTDDQTTRLVALARANMRTIKPDPTSMGSEIVVDWAPVVSAAAGFLDPKQLTLVQAQADRLTKSK